MEKNKRRIYSLEQKAAVLAVTDSCDSQRQASRVTAVADSTIDRFKEQVNKGDDRAEILEKLRSEKKEQLADAFERIAWKCCWRLRDSSLIEESKNLTAISAVGGTAVDKMRLLREQPTTISESRASAEAIAAAAERIAREYGLPPEQVREQLEERAKAFVS